MTQIGCGSWALLPKDALKPIGRCMPIASWIIIFISNLADGMKWLLQTYTSRFNRRHKYFGHLFSGRYKALSPDALTGYLSLLQSTLEKFPANLRKDIDL